MHLVILGTDYYPIRTSAAVQLEDLALQFIEMGIDITVITPSGSLRRSCDFDSRKGVEIMRLPSIKIKNVGNIHRFFGELLLSFTMGIGFIFSQGLFRRRIDGIICYSPSIFFGPLLFFFKKKYNCRVYLILRDLFPQWAYDLGLIKNHLVYNFFKIFEYTQYRVSDIIGVQSPSNLNFIKPYSGVQFEILHNWLAGNEKKSCSIDFKLTGLAGKKILIYAGNMGVAQNLDSLINFAIKISKRADIGFALVGRGSEVARLKTIALNLNLTNILFLDEVDSSEMTGLLSQCFAGLLALDMRHKTHNIPGKFLSYLRAGLPVIANVSNDSDLSRMIVDNHLGFITPNFSYDDVQCAVENLNITDNYKKMSSNSLMYFEKNFSVETAALQLCNAFIKT